jgi:hypothetical protein
MRSARKVVAKSPIGNEKCACRHLSGKYADQAVAFERARLTRSSGKPCQAHQPAKHKKINRKVGVQKDIGPLLE